MKIGIITFHNAVNYGAVLQAYALRKSLKIITGFDAEVIDYLNPKISVDRQIYRMKNNYSVKGIVKQIVSLPFLKKRNLLFKEFLNKNVFLSNMRYDEKNISELNYDYDVLVFGSDQIWNLFLTGDDFHYYGDFIVNSKAVAYAASFGNFDLRIGPERIKDFLERFDAISVREKEDIKSLRQYLEVDAEHVVDPTFLLCKDNWYEIEEKIITPKKYILLYLVSPTKNDFLLARKIKKSTRLPIVYINYNYKYSFGMKNMKNVSPSNFLFLLHHADFVITNSFHGVALSINYNKNFYWINSPVKGKSNKRILEILERWGLEQCIVTEKSLPDSRVFNISWSDVNNYIKNERLRSIDFLRKALEINN